jgi:uroporphyrinogen decarboxylase
MCGDVSAHLEVLAETGADGVSVDTMVDMEKAAGVFGPGMAVFGNIDAAGVLLRGSPEEVERETRSMLKRMASVKGYIPASSCGIPGHTPPENIESFTRTVRQFTV